MTERQGEVVGEKEQLNGIDQCLSVFVISGLGGLSILVSWFRPSRSRPSEASRPQDQTHLIALRPKLVIASQDCRVVVSEHPLLNSVYNSSRKVRLRSVRAPRNKAFEFYNLQRGLYV